MKSKNRLIDVDALGIGKAKREAFNNPAYADGWNCAISIIEEAPTIDAVEVLRCKDCKFANKDGIHKNSLVCTRFNTGQFTHRMWPDDFCSYGERRNDE